MTTMNWENLAMVRSNDRRDWSTDFPPRVGSWRDQARYGVVRRKAQRHQQSDVQSIVPSAVFNQLKAFLASVTARDFSTKSTFAKEELLGGLRKLIARCDAIKVYASQDQLRALTEARRLCEH